MYASHISQPSTTAIAVVASVIKSGIIRIDDLCMLQAAGWMERTMRRLAFLRSDLVSVSDMASLVCHDEYNRRQHDDIRREHEERRMPDVGQQAETGRGP